MIHLIRIRAILVAFLASAMSACAASPDIPPASPQMTASHLERLQAGGLVLVMRHGKSPHHQSASVGMTAGCVLGEGRGLSPKGLAEARAMGSFLAENEIPVLKGYTSDMCRAWDTARLVAGDTPVLAHPSQKTTDPAKIAAFKALIDDELAAHPGQSILLVSHSNIAPLYGAQDCADEGELAEGQLFLVDPANWTTIAYVTPRLIARTCSEPVD